MPQRTSFLWLLVTLLFVPSSASADTASADDLQEAMDIPVRCDMLPWVRYSYPGYIAFWDGSYTVNSQLPVSGIMLPRPGGNLLSYKSLEHQSYRRKVIIVPFLDLESNSNEPMWLVYDAFKVRHQIRKNVHGVEPWIHSKYRRYKDKFRESMVATYIPRFLDRWFDSWVDHGLQTPFIQTFYTEPWGFYGHGAKDEKEYLISEKCVPVGVFTPDDVEDVIIPQLDVRCRESRSWDEPPDCLAHHFLSATRDADRAEHARMMKSFIPIVGTYSRFKECRNSSTPDCWLGFGVSFIFDAVTIVVPMARGAQLVGNGATCLARSAKNLAGASRIWAAAKGTFSLRTLAVFEKANIGGLARIVPGGLKVMQIGTKIKRGMRVAGARLFKLKTKNTTRCTTCTADEAAELAAEACRTAQGSMKAITPTKIVKAIDDGALTKLDADHFPFSFADDQFAAQMRDLGDIRIRVERLPPTNGNPVLETDVAAHTGRVEITLYERNLNQFTAFHPEVSIFHEIQDAALIRKVATRNGNVWQMSDEFLEWFESVTVRHPIKGPGINDWIETKLQRQLLTMNSTLDYTQADDFIRLGRLPPGLTEIPMADGFTMTREAWKAAVQDVWRTMGFDYLRESNSYLQQVYFYRRVDPCLRSQIATKTMDDWAALGEQELRVAMHEHTFPYYFGDGIYFENLRRLLDDVDYLNELAIPNRFLTPGGSP